MLNNISWTHYLAIVFFLLLVYYSIIVWKFYSLEIKQWLSGKRKVSILSASNLSNDGRKDEVSDIEVQPVQPELFSSFTVPCPDVAAADNSNEQAKELTRSLKEVIAEAFQKNYIKEEFILSLQLLFKKHAFLKASPLQAAINNLIASECEKYGYIQLSDEERIMLWNE